MLPQLRENLSNSVHPTDTVLFTSIVNADVGKPVKLSADSTFTTCADGDDIEGRVYSVDMTYPDGTIVGTVQRGQNLRMEVVNKSAGVLAIGATVVAAAQATSGTAALPYVKAGAGVSYVWRVVSHLGGTGAVDSNITIERVR